MGAGGSEQFADGLVRDRRIHFVSPSNWRASVDLSGLDRETHGCPRRKLGRLPAGHFVCERNLIGRIRTQVGMRFPVTEHLGNFVCPRKGTREILLWDLLV